MPRYNVSSEWSNVITVVPGNIIQNTCFSTLLVCPVTPASDSESLDLYPQTPGIEFKDATQIRVRSSGTVGSFKIIVGI